jgi:hypothetical protein
MDWVTLTRQQTENGALPQVCMACGNRATCWVNKSFSYTPDWIVWLYLAGIVPGIVAEHFFTKQMRVACPCCHAHRRHWLVLYWTAGVGWLLAGLLFAGAGYLLATALAAGSSIGAYIGLGVGAGLGIVLWIGVLIYLCNTRITATKVTEQEITLQRVADTFARAVRDQPQKRGHSSFL